MKDITFMQIAYLVSQESKCVSWKCGAIIVKNDRIISTGYNGTPQGAINCCDHAKNKGWTLYDNLKCKTMLLPAYRQDHSEWSSKYEIHAEANSILFAARNGTSIDGATMYVTLSPCSECAKLITQSGIKKLVYSELYDRNGPSWDEILKDSGVEVIQVDKKLLTHLNFNKVQNFGGYNEPNFIS